MIIKDLKDFGNTKEDFTIYGKSKGMIHTSESREDKIQH